MRISRFSIGDDGDTLYRQKLEGEGNCMCPHAHVKREREGFVAVAVAIVFVARMMRPTRIFFICTAQFGFIGQLDCCGLMREVSLTTIPLVGVCFDHHSVCHYRNLLMMCSCQCQIDLDE